MRRLARLSFIGLVLALPGAASADLELSGSVRDDAFLQTRETGSAFFNLLETQLVLQRRAGAWRFYSDVRLQVLSGDISSLLPEDLAATEEFYLLQLLRAFIRYDTGGGVVTLGKTYANFGVAGLFNPFELDRAVNLSDLNYTKAGLLALTYEAMLSDLSGVKAYVSPEAEGADASGGASFYTHWGTFDLGMVALRQGGDDNLAGVYLQGDLELGVQAAWAYRTRDNGSGGAHEAVAGVDYSFWDGRLVAQVQGYYHGQGAGVPVTPTVTEVSGLGQGAALAGFSDEWYLYANLTYIPDEFFQATAMALVNLSDHSSLLIPQAAWILADGLTLTLQAWFPTGTGATQYSREALGTGVLLARLEATL